MAPLDAVTCAAAGSTAWPHRDPFDRVIAAAAIQLACPSVPSDKTGGIVARVW